MVIVNSRYCQSIIYSVCSSGIGTEGGGVGLQGLVPPIEKHLPMPMCSIKTCTWLD